MLTDNISFLQSLECKRLVFVYGHFNIVHPGHLRLLKFASECGDYLIVGVYRDDAKWTLVPEELRLNGVSAINIVDHAFLMDESVEKIIVELKPHIIVKGKEFENHINTEQSLVESYGGKLLFSSGDSHFSSHDLLNKELITKGYSTINKPSEFPYRHGFKTDQLIEFIKKFSILKIIVVGDLIIDEYINCDPLGMSQEDPTIVVTPLKNELFLGGSAIVAAHAKALGAQVQYFSVVGNDEAAKFAFKALKEDGIDAHLYSDETRPTTLKQRFTTRGKTLLRVSHLRQHEISEELAVKIKNEISSVLPNGADLLVFSDFNYGVLTQNFVNEISTICKEHGVTMVADSQSSSQVGDISRFKDMLLITPTEHEARLAVRENNSGLAVLAQNLQDKANAEHVFITLGSEGVFVHKNALLANDFVDDQLPAFNLAPKDVSGAGDCMLITASMALIAGANIWESAYLGSIASACQVGRVGNVPLNVKELIQEVMR